jgi:hypothetical protein
MMGIGAAQERVERMLLLDREAHIAWVETHVWQWPTALRRRWPEAVAALLVRLAERIAPTVTAPLPPTRPLAR